jgi:hypothetical protein
MQVFERQEFECFYDDGSRTFSNIEFRRCSFTSSSISITCEVHQRSTIRNVRLIGCEVRGCSVDTAIVEDVLVDGLKTHGLLQTWAAVFRHVTIKGKLGRLMFSPFVAAGTANARQQREFDEANAAYYSTVDWALDISEVECEEMDIRRVPARLIRRDPATQVMVTREKAMQGRWRELDLSRTYWATAIKLFLEDGDPDLVLVAPKRHRKFRDYLDGLKALRDAGVAEPD